MPESSFKGWLECIPHFYFEPFEEDFIFWRVWGNLTLYKVYFNFTYVIDQKNLCGKKCPNDLRWSNLGRLFPIVPRPQAEATYDCLRRLENDVMCCHDHAKAQVSVVLKHVFMVEKQYVTFVVFIKEKEERIVAEASTLSRHPWFIHPRLYEYLFHYSYCIFGYNWKRNESGKNNQN